MGILVCYDDFTYDVVSDSKLNHLLENGSIFGYDSSVEWVKRESPSPPAPIFSAPRKGQARRGPKARRG